MQPSIRVIPSNDSAFQHHVDHLAASGGFLTEEALAARLRSLFPRVVVRASVVSGQEHVWYVYRDGVWRSSGDHRWWAGERTPRVSVSSEGWIETANAPARAILGLGPADAMPRFFTDFVVPGTLQDATDLFSLVAAGHELAATILIRPANGETIACDIHAWSEDGRIHGAFRLADDILVQPGGPDLALPRLVCEPRADVLFARYAEEALAGMPEPTPDGLAIRLRRLYPHARVEGGDGTWAVTRDAADVAGVAGVIDVAAERDVAGETDAWWRADDLAAVRYDGQGLIFDANDAARRLLGDAVVGRHWQDLVTPGTTDQVATVLRLIADVGSAVSRFRMPRPDGYLFEFDSYTEVAGDAFLTVMRPAAANDATAD